jgi:hypothetical protein
MLTDEPNIYDRLDPYVEAYPLKNKLGEVGEEKYASTNENEHYAESFAEYTEYPERFRNKMQTMESQLRTLILTVRNINM